MKISKTRNFISSFVYVNSWIEYEFDKYIEK